MWEYTGNFDLAFAAYLLDFTRPWALLALVAVIFVIFLSARSLVAATRFRRNFSTLLRCLAVIALVLALAGTRLVMQSKLLCVNVLVDTSASIDPQQRDALLAKLQNQFKTMQAHDRLAITGFASQCAVQQLPTDKPVLAPMQGEFREEFTDIGKAIRLGLSTSLPNASNRILLITDGRDSVSDSTAISAAAAAGSAGVPIDVVAVDSPVSGDVRVERLAVSPQVRSDQPFDIKAVVYSDSVRNARMLLYRRGRAVNISGDDQNAGIQVRLKKGYNLIDVTSEKIPSGGFYDYELFIEPSGNDKLQANNSANAVVRVHGRSGVIIVDASKDGRQGSNLLRALQSSDMDAALVSPAEMPDSVLDMASVSALVLSDVPADALSDAQMDMIRNWVHTGGGFVWVGGENSYGPGGFSGTPIEEVSPVSCDVKRHIERASLALAIAIDQSGSMGATVSGGVTKMELANNAAADAVKLLDDRDLAGITMVDTKFKWITSPHILRMDSGNKSHLVRSVLANKTGGGGIYVFTALKAAYGELKHVDTASKHILLFADASDSEQQPGCVRLVRQAVNEGMTVSVVGLGDERTGKDSNFLKSVAKEGKGRVFFTDDPRKLPTIFVRDVSMASKNAFIEPKEGIIPAIVAAADGVSDPILRGIPAVPKLSGQVATTLKGRSRLLMYGPKQEDSLLARWRFGLGKSVAWTSDATGHWAKNWVSWEAFSQFWTQIVRWAQKNVNLDSPVSTWTTIRADKGKIIADAVDKDGNSITGMDLRAVVQSSDPSAVPLEVQLRQSAPGRYEGDFDVDKRGSYVVTVVDSNNAPLDAAAASLSYSPEFSQSGADMSMIEQIAKLSGGRVLDMSEDLFEAPDRISKTFRPISQFLLALGLFLFFLDIVARRLVLPEWFVSYFDFSKAESAEADTAQSFVRTAPANKVEPLSVNIPTDSKPRADLDDNNEYARQLDQAPEASKDLNTAKAPTAEKPMSMSERLKAAKKRARDEIQDMQKEE